MNAGTKKYTELTAYIQANWKRKTDFDLAYAFNVDGNIPISVIRSIRRRLGLRRDREMLERMYSAHNAGRLQLGRGVDKVMQRAERKHRKQESEEWNGFGNIIEAHRKWIFAILRYQSTESDESIADRLYATPRSIYSVRRKYRIKHYHILPSDYRAM